jgi:asparagine synthase (glutamine-hydrolysing)
MCGIAGLVGRLAADAPATLTRMTTALRHRGPDDEGFLLAGPGWARPYAGPDTVPALSHPRLPGQAPADAQVALGHRRLSIVDLSPGGHGPMASPDGALWVTYNGEIFNYVELRQELRRAGHDFRTASDTEVLLAAYAEWGPSALDRFNGMWAFALYDARSGTLFCARDRFGVKPFHYWQGDGVFAFASEIKGLLAGDGVGARVRDAAVYAFLAEGALDESERTFFEEVRSLPGGHSLTVRVADGSAVIRPWYHLPEDAERPGEAAELRDLLEDAVRLRLRSDVDVGTCLSGGLDSSSIVALTARLRPEDARGAHRSFTITYQDAGLDETPHVDAVVAATGVGSRRATPTGADLLRDLPALVRAQDEPFPSAGVYSQWRVMRLAAEDGVKVLLDGQGGDEVLAGYDYHYGPYLAEVASTRGWRVAWAEARRAHAVTGRPASFYAGLLAYHALPVPGALRRRAVAAWASHGRVPEGLLAPEGNGRAETRSERHRPRRRLAAERRANLLQTSLPALLRYEDRNSMAFSVEARTPFLDVRLVERALALPASALIREGWTKAILRDAMAGLLPEPVRRRRDKLGFATPEKRWLSEIAPAVRGWLAPGARVERYLRPGVLASWRRSRDEEFAARRGLWRLLAVELWLRYVEGARAR